MAYREKAGDVFNGRLSRYFVINAGRTVVILNKVKNLSALFVTLFFHAVQITAIRRAAQSLESGVLLYWLC